MLWKKIGSIEVGQIPPYRQIYKQTHKQRNRDSANGKISGIDVHITVGISIVS